MTPASSQAPTKLLAHSPLHGRGENKRNMRSLEDCDKGSFAGELKSVHTNKAK